MTALESRYRRLLTVYPADHRQAYEGEMLGVLMSGARPGQRFPGLAEAADLIRAGFLARLGTGRRALRSDAWRDAAAVVSLLTALLMLGVTGAALPFGVRMMFYGESPLDILSVYGQPLAMNLVRPAAWLAVIVAILAGRRRTAAALGVVAVGIEVVRFAAWPPIHLDIAMHMAWSPVVLTLCAGSLFVAIRGRTAGAVLGRRGLGLVAVSVAFGLAIMAGYLPVWLYGSTIGTSSYGLPEPLVVVAIAPLVVAAARAGWRTLALLTSALVVPLGHALLWNLPLAPYAVDLTLLLTVLIVLPVGTFVAMVRGFGRAERGEVEGP